MAGRLAKQAGLAHGDQAVAIISFNDSRYGAWNQTQLIGAQAGVETFRANSPEMLEVLLQELASRRLVIIDTPGGDLDNQLQLLTTLLPRSPKTFSAGFGCLRGLSKATFEIGNNYLGFGDAFTA